MQTTTGERERGEEGDEEKMEKFYALIRKFREAREKRREELRESEKKKMRRLNGEQSTWIPSFRWEDFAQEIEFRRPPLIFPSPCNHKIDDDGKQQHQSHKQQGADLDDDAGLDLKLTL